MKFKTFYEAKISHLLKPSDPVIIKLPYADAVKAAEKHQKKIRNRLYE
jgi:hypothetical protein